MMTRTNVITREDLYELVWSTPMIKVAEKFDVSGIYLARVCAALRVPRPERGYWAKLAVGGRYSNINKLTGHRHQAMVDPIARWGEIASQIMQTLATPRERERAQMNGRMASIAFGDAAASLMSDLNQQRMDVAPLHVRASELDTAAKYAIYALVTLIAALRDVIDSLCDSAWTVNRAAQAGAAEVPAMKEFLQFAWADRQYVMRKRQWP